jgi:hypothetical protein
MTGIKSLPAMRVDIAQLRQQQWRADKLYNEFRRFAVSIGCKVGEGTCSDEIMATNAQARELARWWQEKTT